MTWPVLVVLCVVAGGYSLHRGFAKANVDPRRPDVTENITTWGGARRTIVTEGPWQRAAAHCADYVAGKIDADRLEVELDLELQPQAVLRQARAGYYPMRTVYEAVAWRWCKAAGPLAGPPYPTGRLALLGEEIPYP